MEGRVLGLDFGGRRIGVAVSDPTGTIARGVMTIPVVTLARAVDQVLQLIGQFGAMTVVIGLPLTLRGDEGEQARVTRLFGAAVEQRANVQVVYVDERFTSKLSDQAMREMNTGVQHRRGKRDQLAAMFILQSYLDRHA